MSGIIKKMDMVREMPPKVLMESIIRLIKRRIRRYAIKFHPVKLSIKDFLDAIGYKTIDEFLNRDPPTYFFNPKDKERIVDTIKKIIPNQ